MSRGRKSTDEKTIRECIILYAELQSYSEVGRRLNLAPNTVKRIVNDDTILQNNADLLQKYEETKEKENQNLLELLKSAKYTNIVTNIVDMFNRDNLEQERQMNGIRNLISLQGNIIDKTIKLEQLDIRKRELALKERELNARLENPDLFSNIVIIDDSKEAAHYYKENGMSTPYAKEN